LLKTLHIITLYNQIKANPNRDVVPRVVCFGAKAAPGYQMAKLIIKLINGVAAVVNQDPAVGDKLKVVFLPNFNVTLAERIYPAADLSEQISLAGKEASGTGNMKFALNGALTIGTLDGANVEIRELVGAENFFLFGLTEEQVTATRAAGYHPRDYYERNLALQQAIDQIAAGAFAPHEPDVFRPIVDTLLQTDAYLLLADYESYMEAQDVVEQTYRDTERWTRMSILNAARCGYFSSDRSVRDYASQIWQVRPVDVASWRQVQTTPPVEDGRRGAQLAGIELSEAEWALLADAPTTISSVMLAVADSGLIGTVLEEGAVAHAPAATARRYAENPLITTVLRQIKAQTRTYRPTYQVRSRSGDQTRDRSRVEPRMRGDTDMLGLCAQIADLLEQKIEPQQAREFKEWLLAIGEAVANAAAEGGFVTVGGATINDREATTLHAMRNALRVAGAG
jgi:hypothetical protein